MPDYRQDLLECFGPDRKPIEFIIRPRSWAGIAHNASHYYGDIYDHEYLFSVTVERILSDDDARLLNTWDGCSTYRTGDKSNRFTSKESMIVRAVEMFKEFGNAGDSINTRFRWLSGKDPLWVL